MRTILLLSTHYFSTWIATTTEQTASLIKRNFSAAVVLAFQINVYFRMSNKTGLDKITVRVCRSSSVCVSAVCCECRARHERAVATALLVVGDGLLTARSCLVHTGTATYASHPTHHGLLTTRPTLSHCRHSALRGSASATSTTSSTTSFVWVECKRRLTVASLSRSISTACTSLSQYPASANLSHPARRTSWIITSFLNLQYLLTKWFLKCRLLCHLYSVLYL